MTTSCLFLLIIFLTIVQSNSSSNTVDYDSCHWTFHCCNRDIIGNCLELSEPIINCTETNSNHSEVEQVDTHSTGDSLVDNLNLSRFAFRPFNVGLRRSHGGCGEGFSLDFSGRCRKIWT